MRTKVCNKCKKELDILEFNKKTSSNDGYNHICKQCRKEYSSKYYKENKQEINKKTTEYRNNNLTECRERIRNYYKENKEQVSKTSKQRYESLKDTVEFQQQRKNSNLKLNYGIDLARYNDMLESQNYKCKICNTDFEINDKSKLYTAYVDHDHETNKVRGLLCTKCNQGLGLFQDNITNLKNAIQYLKNTK